LSSQVLDSKRVVKIIPSKLSLVIKRNNTRSSFPVEAASYIGTLAGKIQLEDIIDKIGKVD
jgi:hypothetical protein